MAGSPNLSDFYKKDGENKFKQIRQPVQYAKPGNFTKKKLLQDCPEADIRVLKDAAAKVVSQPGRQIV